MRYGLQGAIWLLLFCWHGTIVHAAEGPAKFVWTSPKVGAGLFDDKLGMLDREREEYATNLANHAAAKVVEGKASPASLAEARKLLALAMHLCARDRKALVVNFQLGKGMIPTVDQTNYGAEVLARLLLTRAQLLGKQGGPQNQFLARCFVELSAQLDPRNEDAIYAYELQRIDHGDVDWKMLTDVKPEAEAESGDDPPKVEPPPQPQPPPKVPPQPPAQPQPAAQPPRVRAPGK